MAWSCDAAAFGVRRGRGVFATGGAAAITSTGKFDVFISPSAIVIACGFSSLVGVFFGFYPARRASRLLPVDCLRYE